MRFSLVSAALLCFATWMSMSNASHAPVRNCCMMWSTTTIPIQRVANYTIQSEGVCPIKAILIHTKLGKTLCSDPKSNWAKRVMQKVDEENRIKALQENGQREEGSTDDITPAAATMSKNGPPKRRRNGRRRKCRNGRRRKCRIGRRGQKKRA